MRTDEQLAELAKKVSAKTIELNLTLNEELNSHLRTPGWLVSHPDIQNKIWRETAYLGCYVTQKKFSAGMSNIDISKSFKLAPIAEEGAKLMIESDYDNKLKKYEAYQGRAAVLFKDEVQGYLTAQTRKTKMNENALGNEIMSKTGSLFGLAGKPAPDSPIPDDTLISVGESAVRLFDAATI